MSKHTYTFEYLVASPARLVGQKLIKKVRAMNEQEAWQRFNRWSADKEKSEEFQVSAKCLATSNDIEWLARHGRIVL